MRVSVEIDIDKAFDDLGIEDRRKFLRRKAEENGAVLEFVEEIDPDNEDYDDSVLVAKSDVDCSITEMLDKFKQEGEESLYSGVEIMLMLNKLNAQLGNCPKGVKPEALYEFGKYQPQKAK